jgi:diguanylate cyclase (GGDEF)-like protein/PAS domain S-box-containing protein
MSFVTPTSVAFEINEVQKLKQGLVEHAFSQLRSSMLATILNAAVLAYLLWEHVEQRFILTWVMVIVAVSFWRYGMALQFERHPNRHTLPEWERRFVTGVVAASVLFGLAAAIFFVPDDFYAQSVLLVIFAGISSGALNTLSAMPGSQRILLILMLMPLAIRLTMEQTYHHSMMAGMVMFFMGMLLVIANRYNRDMVTTLRSGILFDKAKQQLALSEERFGMIFREAPVGIFFYDTDLHILESNQEFSTILRAPMEHVIGLDMNTLNDKRVLPAIRAVLQGQEGHYEGEYMTTLSTSDIFITLRSVPVLDAQRELIGGIGIVTDITERMIAQEKIRRQAYYDTLTDIPNRVTLMEQLRHCTIRFKRHGEISALLFLDLDHFKKINDSLGHVVGDELLRETAARLKLIVREEDFVARLGGDEFVILLPDLGDSPTTASTKAEHVAEKVHQELAIPFEIMGHRLNSTASIGVAMTDASNADPDSLLKHADTAMYQVKKEGRGKTSFYQIEMDRWIKSRLQLESDLRQALERDTLELHYQPVVAFNDNRIVGAEALLRWNHPERGYLPPNEVVELAEETGLIMPLGQWVLETACRQLKQWQLVFPEMASMEQIAINVSTLQFRQNDYPDRVIDTIVSYGVDPRVIVLEMTESVMIEKTTDTVRKMQWLRDQGIGIAIDDFGAGYASLSYLKKLPFTTLKIDRSYIQDLVDDKDDAILVETIVAIARKFDLRIVAEGVETCEQYRFLNAAQCHMYQGYLCNLALPADDFAEFFRAPRKLYVET